MPIAKTYKKPSKSNMIALTEKGKSFLTDRGITEEVIKNNKIVSTRNDKSILFPYFKDGQIINYKTRGIDGKSFTQSKDAESIIYNYDNCVDQKTIVICEGEIDSLSWEVAGITSHTSVNMGAPNSKDSNIDKKLECLSNCYDIFKNADVIYGNSLIINERGERIRNFFSDKFSINAVSVFALLALVISEINVGPLPTKPTRVIPFIVCIKV